MPPELNYPNRCHVDNDPAKPLVPVKCRKHCRQHARHLRDMLNMVSHWRYAPLGSVFEIVAGVLTPVRGATAQEMRDAWAKLPPKFRTAMLAATGRTAAFLQSRPLPEPRFKAFVARFIEPWRVLVRNDELHWDAITGANIVLDPEDNTQKNLRKQEMDGAEYPFDEAAYPGVF